MSQVEKFDFHNPLENTASILKGLAHEIQELRDGLASEQTIRATEINALRKAFEDESGELPDRVSALTKEIEEWRKTHTHRFERVEHRLSEVDMEFGGRLDRFETKLHSEVEDRLQACQDIVKKINVDGSQWKGRCSSNERDITDLRQALENACMLHSQRHDQCKGDVDKIASMLRESTLAKDTFEQFVSRPSTPRRPTTPTTASPGSSRNYTPTRVGSLHLSSPSHAFAPMSLADGESKGNSRMRLRLSGLR